MKASAVLEGTTYGAIALSSFFFASGVKEASLKASEGSTFSQNIHQSRDVEFGSILALYSFFLNRMARRAYRREMANEHWWSGASLQNNQSTSS